MMENKKYDICCLGHITLDKVVTPAKEVYMPGGTAFYFARALARIDHSGFLLVASLADKERKAAQDIAELGVETIIIPSKNSVFFENIYGENMNDRKQRVLAKADPFSVENIKDIDASFYHLGTLLADDFPPEVIKELSKKGKVSVDVQGFLRRVDGESVHPTDWEEKLELLPYIDILKANEHEMLSLTGSEDPYQAARMLAEWGVKEVVITLGDKGSVIYTDGQFYDIAAYPVKEMVDATGCGDTYMAGYLLKRARGCNPSEAGHYAAAMCSLKLQESGPFRGTEKEIRQLMARYPI